MAKNWREWYERIISAEQRGGLFTADDKMVARRTAEALDRFKSELIWSVENGKPDHTRTVLHSIACLAGTVRRQP